MKFYKRNIVHCKKCGDTLIYENKTKDDVSTGLMKCKCGAVALDPAACFYRILGESEDYIDLSEEWK